MMRAITLKKIENKCSQMGHTKKKETVKNSKSLDFLNHVVRHRSYLVNCVWMKTIKQRFLNFFFLVAATSSASIVNRTLPLTNTLWDGITGYNVNVMTSGILPYDFIQVGWQHLFVFNLNLCVFSLTGGVRTSNHTFSKIAKKVRLGCVRQG